MNNDLEDEIIIGIDCPKKKKSTKVAKKATSQNIKKVDKNKKIKSKPKTKNTKKSNKKGKKKASKKPMIIILVLFAIAGILAFLLTSSLFKIKEVQVNDNSKVTKAEIEEIANFESYRNIFWLNPRKVEKELKENNAYIENVKVSRKLANKVEITVKERVPKYMLQFADSYVYINNQGYMLEVSTENINLPIILGFKTDLSNIEVRKKIRYRRFKKDGKYHKNSRNS